MNEQTQHAAVAVMLHTEEQTQKVTAEVNAHTDEQTQKATAEVNEQTQHAAVAVMLHTEEQSHKTTAEVNAHTQEQTQKVTAEVNAHTDEQTQHAAVAVMLHGEEQHQKTTADVNKHTTDATAQVTKDTKASNAEEGRKTRRHQTLCTIAVGFVFLISVSIRSAASIDGSPSSTTGTSVVGHLLHLVRGQAMGRKSTPLPKSPLKGQARAPCPQGTVTRNGNCWVVATDPQGDHPITPPCPSGTYESGERCLFPVGEDGAPLPSSTPQP